MRDDGFDYPRYLASREWAVLKEQVRKRSGNKCERCFAAPYQQTHHVTYERIGHERLDDLLGLCRDCHEYLSAKTETDPRTKGLVAGCLTNNGAWSGEWAIACPTCAFDYSHIAGVFTRCGSDRDEAESQAYHGAPPLDCTSARRSALVIVFDGECGHIWEMEIQQHKGNNLVRSKALGEMPEGMPRWSGEPEVESDPAYREADPGPRGDHVDA